MASVLKISEAASLALHSMTYLAAHENGKPVSTKEISDNFGISEAHLSKVFQRLSRVGLVRTQRGPGGGVRLGKPAADVTLLDIFEAIEGPIEYNSCILGAKTCDYASCILGQLANTVNHQVRDYLKSSNLAVLAGR